MQINVTAEAADNIRNRYFADNRSGTIKLVYDSEGCGCAVSGVAALWILHEPGPGEVMAECEQFPVCYEARHELFFEEKLIVDFNAATRSLILKSANQTYNPTMRVTDMRGR